MKLSQFLVLIVCTMLVLITVVSCGNSDDTAGNGITLEFWQFWTDPQAKAVIDSLADEFEQDNPGIAINITDLTWGEGHSKIVVAFSTGNAPDIVELGSDWIPEFSSRGTLADLSPLVEDLLDERIMWEPAMFDGAYYAIPWFLDTRAIFYNKELLGQTGFETGYSPRNWEEFADACRKVNGLGDGIAGFGANSYEKHRLYKKFLPFVWTNGGSVLDSSFNSVFDSEQVLQALRYYLELVDAGAIDNQRNLDMRFINGTLGFNFSGGWLLKNIERNRPDLNFGVMPVPSPSGDAGVSFAGGEYLAISSQSKHPEQAVKFAKFLTEAVNTVRLCKTVGFGFPSTREIPDDPFFSESPHRQVFHKQLLNSRTPPSHPKWVYIEQVIEKTVEKGMYGKGTPDELLKQADQEIRQILAEESN